MGTALDAADDLFLVGAALLLTSYVVLRRDFTAMIMHPEPRFIVRRDTVRLWSYASFIAGAIVALPVNIANRDWLGIAVDCVLVITCAWSAREAWRHRASHPLRRAQMREAHSEDFCGFASRPAVKPSRVSHRVRLSLLP